METCNPFGTSGFGSELSTEQSVKTLLSKEGTTRYQAIAGWIVYWAQITRYDTTYASCQLARAMSKPAKARMDAAKHLLRYLSGSTPLAVTYKRGGFKLAGFSDSNWGNNPDNGQSTSA